MWQIVGSAIYRVTGANVIPRGTLHPTGFIAAQSVGAGRREVLVTMTNSHEGRIRRDGRSRRRPASSLRQLPWRQVTNPYAPLAMLSDDELESIHETSLRVLEVLGIEVMSSAARRHLAMLGADVDNATGIVKIDRALVSAAIATAPSAFTLRSRNDAKALVIGGRHLVFGLVAGPPNVHDCERGRRSGNYRDYCDFIRLAHHFNAIHIIGNQVCAPMEMPANTRHLDTYYANLTLSDLAFHCSAIGAGRARDAAHMAAIARGETLDDLINAPAVMSIININSPRRFDEAMADGLIALASLGQPVVITPFTLMGAMAPMNLAAALAQQNAEMLFGLVLAQAVRPGTPVVYGAFTSNVDLRSGAPAFGTPENAKANAISGQLARKYGLPYRSSNASASNVADAQGAYETQMSLWGAVMGHANLIYHAAGWQEGGLTASFEKLVLDVEMLQMMMVFLTPITVTSPEDALAAIAETVPGGHYFGAPHTLAHYEHAFYEPLLSNWQNHENWQLAGGLDATRRATAIWKQALSDYVPPELDPARREALDAYVRQRKADIGSEEP